MPHDFEVEPGLSFGEWLRREIESEVLMERSGFFTEQVARVAARLQADRPADDRMEVLIPWSPVPTAFTAPGRYIYFNRSLLEKCATDEAVAFVIAHEIAHHDLGHINLFRSKLARRLADFDLGAVAFALFHSLQKRLYSPEWECAADRRAMDLCVRAGYDPEAVMRVFRILEHMALDRGDIDAVWGLDEEIDSELSPDAPWVTKARIWLWQRRRGYLPIQDRAAEVRRHLEEASPMASAS